MAKFVRPNERVVRANEEPIKRAYALIGLIAEFDSATANELQEWLEQYKIDLFRAKTLEMHDALHQLSIAFEVWYNASLLMSATKLAPPFTTLEVREGWIGYWMTEEHAKRVSKHYCGSCGMYADYDDLRVLHDQDGESLMYHTLCMHVIECTVYAPGHVYPRDANVAWYDVGKEHANATN